MTNADALDAVRETEAKLTEAYDEIDRLRDVNADLLYALGTIKATLSPIDVVLIAAGYDGTKPQE